MKRSDENTVSVVQRTLKFYKIKVTSRSVREMLKSHSDYPTFKSICESLSAWNIKHYPLRYSINEIQDLRSPYIVHINRGGGQIAFVTKVNKDMVTLYDSFSSKKKVSMNYFLERCSGAIIVIDPDKSSGEKDYWNKRQDEIFLGSILPISILVMIAFLASNLMINGIDDFLNFSCFHVLFITKILGMIICCLMVFHELEISLPITEKICHLNKNTSCKRILSDKKAKVFSWISWADIGMIYFLGSFIFFTQSISHGWHTFLIISSTLALPFTFFSLYYQAVVIGKWCPLCLSIQFLLIVEFLILFSQFRNLEFTILELATFILIFLTIGLVYLIFNVHIREMKLNNANYFKLLNFKKDPAIFKTLISKEHFCNFPNLEKSIVIGDKNSNLKITAFLSLNCIHCSTAFNRIYEILKSNINICLIIVPISKDATILKFLYYLNLSEDKDTLLKFLKEWYNSDLYSRQKFFENHCDFDIDTFEDGCITENNKLYKECEVRGTPTFFINGYKLPTQYEIDDIKHFSGFFIQGKSIL